MKPIFALLLVILIVSCNNDNDAPATDLPKGPAIITYSVINTYPHDTSSFTEGLLVYKGDLYESTGLQGKSKIMQIDLKTGKAIRSLPLESQYFGEGIVIVNDTIYQLTYQEKIGFMYSVKDFRRLGTFTFASPEGWGMTTDGTQIIASDGTSNLYFYQPGTFKLLRTQAVSESGGLVANINELEYIDGFIYANQWQSSYVLKIDPSNGEVVGKSDLSDIFNRVKTNHSYVDFLNGIAYDPQTKKIYVTGKLWPELYEVQFSK
ncbi:MAG: glutaminyl-peptide cyclotransferase [Chitinophagaceae bacterium]|nr:glutaminyl-peptide cyclotransferase [Chitinophagaceae bacterium]